MKFGILSCILWYLNKLRYKPASYLQILVYREKVCREKYIFKYLKDWTISHGTENGKLNKQQGLASAKQFFQTSKACKET